MFAQTEHEKSIAECINLSQKLSPYAHHQYKSVDSNADILPSVFQDCYERTFELISKYVSLTQLQQGVPSQKIIDIGQTNPHNRSSFELFTSYINNFLNYQELKYPYISFVNFRKSLEAFFFEKPTAINAHTEKKFILESKQYESLDRLWKEFTKSDSSINKSLSAPELTYFKTVINGI